MDYGLWKIQACAEFDRSWYNAWRSSRWKYQCDSSREVNFNLILDILLIGETKLNSSFPDEQFLIKGNNKPLRLDVSRRSGAIIVFTKSDLPTRQLTKLKIPMEFAKGKMPSGIWTSYSRCDLLS